jgi:pimeloyl-ACP methyl ester carboxylesterase
MPLAQVTDAALIDTPAWFTRALATTPEGGEISVDAATIRFRAWGPRDGPGVVLVHGGAAHARWWDHIGPLLADGFRVVALDLSGHGDSEQREDYSLDQWADEVLAVVSAGGIGKHPVIIGHSMGGLVALRCAARYGPQLRGAVAVDSPVREFTPEDRAAREHQAFGPLRVYPSREDAISRFRTLPDQWTLPFVKDHVAETSVREVDGGWCWKFDPVIFQRDPAATESVLPVSCPVILMPAEFGLQAGAVRGAVVDQFGREAPTIEIPGAAHHVMLDSPIALITSLRTIVAVWHRWPPST